MTDVETKAMRPSRRHRARHTASVLLIVFVAILTPLVVTAGWAVTTVTDTNRFVSTMSALGTNPTVTNYVAAEGASTIVTNLHVEKRIAESLPHGASFLAPYITTQVQQEVTKLLSSVLASQRFQSIWIDKVRLLHHAFVLAMTTNQSKVQSGAKLALDITPQLLSALDQLDKRNIHFLDPARKYLTGDKHLLVTLAKGQEFHAMQYYFHVATQLRWVLWVATLVLAAAAVLVDPRRRRSGFWLAIGVACSCVVMLALLAVGKQYAMSHSPTPPAVADVIFSTITSWLRWELRAVVIIGLIVALVLWFTGPTRHARRLRALFGKEGGKAAHAVEGKIGEHATETIEGEGTTAIDWVARHGTAIAWLGVIVGGIVLATWADSLLKATVVILLVVSWFAAIVGIRRRVAAAATQPKPVSGPPASSA